MVGLDGLDGVWADVLRVVVGGVTFMVGCIILAVVVCAVAITVGSVSVRVMALSVALAMAGIGVISAVEVMALGVAVVSSVAMAALRFVTMAASIVGSRDVLRLVLSRVPSVMVWLVLRLGNGMAGLMVVVLLCFGTGNDGSDNEGSHSVILDYYYKQSQTMYLY